MNKKLKVFKKITSVLSGFSLVAQSLLPGFTYFTQRAYAQEATYTSTVSVSPSKNPTPEPTIIQIPTPETIPNDQPTPTDTIAPTSTETLTPPAEQNLALPDAPTVEPTPTTTEPPKETGPPDLTPILTHDEPTAEAASIPLWQSIDGQTDQTTQTVVPGREYRYRSTAVSLVFTTLPLNPGTLTIKEVKLTPQEQESISALSDTAYDITSSMENSSFRYNLTLPLPLSAHGQSVGIKSAESLDTIDDAATVTQPNEVTANNVTIRDLDHFTVFVLVNDVDTDNPDDLGDENDIANGTLSTIGDSWIDEDNTGTTHGTSTDVNVQSKSTNKDQRSLIQFDTASIPAGSSITKATLRLFLSDAPSGTRTYEAFRITSMWDESTVTWASQPTTEGAATANAATGTTNNTWLEWDVTGDIEGFIAGSFTNYGWMIKDSSEEGTSTRQGKFNSSEHGTESKRPQLVVDFAESENQPTEYNSPSDQMATTGGDGNGFETNPTNAFTDGGGFATNANGAGDRHIFSDYGFSIPSGSTINGIEVRTDWYLDATGGTNSLSVELSWDGGTSWTGAKSDITETNQEHIATLGGSSDTWDRTWADSDFSDNNFRVRVSANATDNNRDFFLDWIPVRVYYSEGDSTPPTSTFSSPSNGSNWNSAIPIEGSSTDIPDTTVNFVTLYSSPADEENWTQITQVNQRKSR